MWRCTIASAVGVSVVVVVLVVADWEGMLARVERVVSRRVCVVRIWEERCVIELVILVIWGDAWTAGEGRAEVGVY